MSGTIGRMISHYEILEQVGAGGMGVVYKARDIKLQRLVAVKFLPPHLITDQKARTRFMYEARAASGFDHPNIGTIYEIDENAKAGLFIVMAYYPGESLAVRLRKGPLPVSVAVDFAIQAGEGLACAHQHHIIHRDVKPGNLMVTAEGVVKILDFGLAKAVDMQETEGLVCLGTPAFMAPERINGEGVDHRCDIWSLGVVLYDMVAGRLPFDSDNIAELLARVTDSDPAALNAPADLQQLIFKALSKRPAHRHKTMKEFVGELHACQQRLGTARHTETMSERPAAGMVEKEPRGHSMPSRAEHRQLTILSCELVGYASLEDRLGAEMLREILLRYYDVCERAIRHLEGQPVHQLDGMLTAHFGHPEAHEDDAFRAVTAALTIAAEVRKLHDDTSFIPLLPDAPLDVRVGVHTGLVIAPDSRVAGHSTSVIGNAGKIAGSAREIAAAHEIVLTEGTYPLVKGFFDVQPLGPRRLSAGKPINTYRVLGRTSAGDRIDAAAAAGVPATILVGRRRELRVLVDCWEGVKEGAGQVVLLSGEAGIGKSRLVKTLRDNLSADRHHCLEGRCSPHHRNSPLFPLVELLNRDFHLHQPGSPEEKLDRLQEHLTAKGLGSVDELTALASLLSIASTRVTQTGLTPQRQREQTLRALFKLVLAFAAEQPLLFVMEDLHWADASTLDFLGLLVDQGPTSRILTILTFRPECATPWDSRGHLVHLTLSRLSPRESDAMVQQLARRRLPAEVTKQVVDNSDGVPLFIEELTKSVVEADTSEAQRPDPTRLDLGIPSTLRDSLMARLDRLGGAKQIAQQASVFGRTFPYQWLEATSPCGERLLRKHLAQLVEAELLYQRGVPPDATYTFKHALIRDAAYASLLTNEKRQYHEEFVRALETAFQDIREAQPELFAHHHRSAGHVDEAASYLWLAGQQALKRSGHIEAAAHFREGLGLLSALPDTINVRQRQLDCVIALGSAQVATMGYAAPAVGEAFARARELCAQVGETPQLFDALQGMYAFHLVRAELKTSLTLARRLKTLAGHLNDRSRELEATLRRGIGFYTLGSLDRARRDLETVLGQCDSNESRETALRFGQDRLVACLSHLSLVLWMTGCPDRAAAASADAVARATALAHPFSIAFALLYQAIVYSLRGEISQTRGCAENLAALCEAQGFAYRLAQSQILDGWTRAVSEQDERAIANIQRAIKRTRATGAEVLLPYYLALLADAALRVRQKTLAAETTSDALAVVRRTGECFFKSELQRLHGESLVDSRASSERATPWFSRALATAGHQKAASFELRAVLSWARVQRHRTAARRQVERVMTRFDEGFETETFRAAKTFVGRTSR